MSLNFLCYLYVNCKSVFVFIYISTLPWEIWSLFRVPRWQYDEIIPHLVFFMRFEWHSYERFENYLEIESFSRCWFTIGFEILRIFENFFLIPVVRVAEINNLHQVEEEIEIGIKLHWSSLCSNFNFNSDETRVTNNNSKEIG